MHHDDNYEEEDSFDQEHSFEQEGKMAKADLYKAAKYSIKLFQMIQDGQNLESWVQSKITKAADYLDSVYHHMEYDTKFGDGYRTKNIDDITAELSSITSRENQEDQTLMLPFKESQAYKQKLKSLLEAADSKSQLKNKACWKGYEAVGLKKKNGRSVPNCVPKK